MSDKLIFFSTMFTFVFFAIAIYRDGTPQTYLLTVLYLLPFMNFLATKESIGGFKTFDVLSICSFLYLLKFFFFPEPKKNGIQLFLFLALLLISIIGALLSEYKYNSLINIVKMLPIFIFAKFLSLECTANSKFHFKIITVLKFNYLIAVIFLFLQTLIGLKFSFYTVLNINTFDPIRGAIRYPGYFHDSQAQGQFFAMGSFFFLHLKPKLGKKQKLYNYFIFICAIIGIILSGSRSAFGGFIIGLSITLLIVSKKVFVYFIFVLVLLQVIYTFLPMKIGVFSRTENLNEDYDFRQTIWKDAFKIFKKYPLFGIGNGNYENYTIRHNPNQFIEVDNEIIYFDQPENGYLKVLVETGVLGFGTFALILLNPILIAFKLFIYKRCDKKVIFLVASITTWLIAFNTVYSLSDNRILILVATISVLLTSYPTIADQNKNGN